MNSLSRTALLTAAFAFNATLLSSAAVAAPIFCSLDGPRSDIKFKATTKIFDAEGSFKDFNVHGKIDPDDFTASQFTITIKTRSIDTDNGRRDDHLRSDDFFDVEKYPTATFKVTKIIKGKKPNWFIVKGVLKIKNTTTKQSLPMLVTTGPVAKGQKAIITTVKGKFKLDRFKVGIDWPGSFIMPDIGKIVFMDVDLSFKH